MDAKAEGLCSELRNTRQEILERLMEGNSSALIKPILLEELHDIEQTLKKIENGDYGKCEISGELLPADLLEMVPTLKTMEDCSKLGKYYRKSIYH
jgi:RNA polymerase-binding transcription factor DksA